MAEPVSETAEMQHETESPENLNYWNQLTQNVHLECTNACQYCVVYVTTIPPQTLRPHGGTETSRLYQRLYGCR